LRCFLPENTVPAPIISGIAHYQFVTIHPYLDGNGRTARLLSTLLFHITGYDIKGIYSLEEYYQKNIADYYQALTIGPSHNYYMGRETSDITPWIAFFCHSTAQSLEAIKRQVEKEFHAGVPDSSEFLQKLGYRQRTALTLFDKEKEYITANELADLFSVHPRSARNMCSLWVQQGFLVVLDPAPKTRKYGLAPSWKKNLSV